jgi:hypothetical protein
MARKKTSEPATEESRAMEERVVAFAEQLGRMVGTVERKTTGWLDMAALSDQLTRIRDGAADLLGHLGGGSASKEPEAALDPAPSSQSAEPDGDSPVSAGRPSRGRTRKTAAPRAAKPPRASSSRSREHVAAPGKTHRKPPVSLAGVKHSSEEVAKATTTERNRRTRGR